MVHKDNLTQIYQIKSDIHTKNNGNTIMVHRQFVKPVEYQPIVIHFANNTAKVVVST